MAEEIPSAAPTDPNPRIIAGFWRRFLAAVIDGLVLGVPAFLLGIVFFAQFARLGPWGRAIGFVVALLYYGLLNSKVANGQTIGKGVLKIRVVGSDQNPISLGRSFLRFVVLGAPIFLNGAAFPPSIFYSWVGAVIGAVIFGVGGSIVYLLVFNRRNRRSLHDLVAGTVVIKTRAAPDASPVMRVWPGHYVAVTILILTFLFVPVFLMRFAERSPYKGVFAVQSALLGQKEVWYAAVFSGKGMSLGTSGKTVTTTTAVTVWTDRQVPNYETFANKIAGIIFDTYPGALVTDRVAVNIIYGYDLGIASGRIGQHYEYSPAEWQQRMHPR